jgi:hypothetical protein
VLRPVQGSVVKLPGWTKAIIAHQPGFSKYGIDLEYRPASTFSSRDVEDRVGELLCLTQIGICKARRRFGVASVTKNSDEGAFQGYFDNKLRHHFRLKSFTICSLDLVRQEK